MTSAALTPAASAIERSPTLKPCSPNCSIAASRIRAAAVRSSTERMFRTLNARSIGRQGGNPSRIRTRILRGGAKSVANGGQQAVAERHQGRSEQLVLGDEPRRLAHRGHLCVAGCRIAGPATGRGTVHDDDAAGAQQPYTFDHVVRLVERGGW